MSDEHEKTERPQPPTSGPVPDAPAEVVDEGSIAAAAANAAERVADVVLTGGAPDAEDVAELVEDAVIIEAPQREATTRRRGKAVVASPVLAMPRATHPEGIVLFIHGGDEKGNLRMWRGDPAYLRVVPFARDVERRSEGRVGAAVLRLAVRGWNDPEKPAVEDTLWALRELRRRFPGLPLAVAGHSMGGRVVLDIGSAEAGQHLAAIVALAPWASDEYDAEPFVGTPLLAIHGTRDRVTEPEATKDLVRRVQEAGGDARLVSMPGGHSMLWQANRWHATCSAFLIDHLSVTRDSDGGGLGARAAS